jgi:hypothetical protein
LRSDGTEARVERRGSVPGKSEEADHEELDEELGEPGAGDDELDAEEGDDGDEIEEIPATAAGRASAARFLELLLEKKVLLLHAKKPGNALIEQVGRLLESPAPLKSRAAKLSEVIVESDDVDDLFIDDETLAELVKRW